MNAILGLMAVMFFFIPTVVFADGREVRTCDPWDATIIFFLMCLFLVATVYYWNGPPKKTPRHIRNTRFNHVEKGFEITEILIVLIVICILIIIFLKGYELYRLNTTFQSEDISIKYNDRKYFLEKLEGGGFLLTPVNEKQIE